MPDTPTRIILADATRLLVEPLANEINADPELNVVGTATDSDSFFLKAVEFRPDIAIVDVDLPGRGSFEIARKFMSNPISPKLIFLSGSPSDILIEQALAVGGTRFPTEDGTPQQSHRGHQASSTRRDMLFAASG